MFCEGEFTASGINFPHADSISPPACPLLVVGLGSIRYPLANMDPYNTPRSAESGEASKQDSWLNKDRHTKAVTTGAQTITREMGLSGCHSMYREDKSQLTKFRDLRSAILFCKRSRSVNEHSARLHGLTSTLLTFI
jgi:hypothetical protein